MANFKGAERIIDSHGAVVQTEEEADGLKAQLRAAADVLGLEVREPTHAL